MRATPLPAKTGDCGRHHRTANIDGAESPVAARRGAADITHDPFVTVPVASTTGGISADELLFHIRTSSSAQELGTLAGGVGRSAHADDPAVMEALTDRIREKVDPVTAVEALRLAASWTMPPTGTPRRQEDA